MNQISPEAVKEFHNKLINQIFDIAIAQWELDTDLGYDATTIADITKNIIETTLQISTEYLEELNHID